jgi:hypothetical protein
MESLDGRVAVVTGAGRRSCRGRAMSVAVQSGEVREVRLVEGFGVSLATANQRDEVVLTATATVRLGTEVGHRWE